MILDKIVADVLIQLEERKKRSPFAWGESGLKPAVRAAFSIARTASRSVFAASRNAR